jgi:hypothetical protein
MRLNQPTWRETFRAFVADIGPSKAERVGGYIGLAIGLSSVAVAVAPLVLFALICSAISLPFWIAFWILRKLWEHAVRPRQIRAAQDALAAHGFKPETYLPE